MMLSRSVLVACRSLSTSAAKHATIGFIGLGNMGGHMAVNLAKGGHDVVVHDMNAEAVKRVCALSKQVSAESSAAAVARRSNTVITMLPSNPHVRSVYFDEAGVLSAVQPGSLLIDASTIDPAVSRAVADQASAAGKDLVFVDAPVSGGVGGAEAGTLTFMVGGEAAAFARAETVLKCMGKNIVHCGAVGTGQVAKLCNNMLLAIGMIGTAEAMNLGVKNGMDPKLLAGILNTSSGRCWSSDTYNPCPGVIDTAPASRGYTGGFGSALMLKDLGLALDAAAAAQAPVPLGGHARELYKLLCAHGNATKDFSSIYEFLAAEKK